MAGFSLLEILVAIGVAAILTMTAMPALRNYVKEYQLAGAANQVGFDIGRARMQAVAQHRFVRLRFTDAHHYVLETSSDAVTYTTDGGAISLPSTVRALEPPAIVFNRNGFSTTAATVQLTNRQTDKTIRTNVLGRVTIS